MSRTNQQVTMVTVGVDFGGSPDTCPPINAHAFITFYHLSPNILVCPLNIFDKSTPVMVTYMLLERERYSDGQRRACARTEDRSSDSLRYAEGLGLVEDSSLCRAVCT